MIYSKNNFFPKHIFQYVWMCLFALLFLSGCDLFKSDDPVVVNINGTFEKLALTEQDIWIESLDVQGTTLYAGTYEDGFMVFDLTTGERTGHHKPGSSVESFLIINDEFWLISATYKDNSQNNGVFKSVNQGETWVNYTYTYRGFNDRITKLIPFSMDYYIDHGKPIIYASESLFLISKSTDGGRNWEAVFGNRKNPILASMEFLKIDPNNSKIIWGGGTGSLFNPWLMKSTNGGDDWEILTTLEYVDSDINDIIIQPNNSKKVMIGLSGTSKANIVMKSTNGGKTWTTVLEEIRIFNFAHSKKYPNLIYGSGQDVSGKLYFAYTSDFGKTWEKHIMEESPDWITTNDLAVTTIEDKEVIIFGTDKGIFSFTVE